MSDTTERGTIKISQQGYAEELAKEHGVEWGKSIPIAADAKLDEFHVEKQATKFSFRGSVESLM